MFDWLKKTYHGIQFERFLKNIDDYQVDVGFNEQSGTYDDGGRAVTVAEVAAFNEFGTENAPSRPFMRDFVRDKEGAMSKFATKAVANELASGDPQYKRLLNQIGSFAKGQVQLQIVKGEYVPNAPSTIAKKHSSKPLIDTGRMRQSVVYVIKKGK